jgi:hypothetical protein
MIRDADTHWAAADERVRHSQAQRYHKHVNAVRDAERAREARRVWAVIATSSRPSDDFEGCVE